MGAGKVEGNMEDRKEMIAIILTGDAVCPNKNSGRGYREGEEYNKYLAADFGRLDDMEKEEKGRLEDELLGCLELENWVD